MKMKKRCMPVACLLLALAFLLSACGGGKNSSGKESAAGYYKGVKAVDNGVENEEYSQAVKMGIYIYLVLNDDGTGYTVAMGEREDLKWNDKEIWYDDSGTTSYTYENGTLTVKDGDSQVIYEKLNEEEKAEFDRTGGNPDLNKLLGGGEGSASSVSGETYDTGLFTVLVPEGWLACPIEDIISGETDPHKINIVKGAKNTDDAYGHPLVQVECNEEEEYYFQDFLYEGYEDIAPVTIGDRTWEGVDAKVEEDNYNYCLHTPLGSGYISANVKYKFGDEEMSLDDADVMAILSSISTESSGTATDLKSSSDSDSGASDAFYAGDNGMYYSGKFSVMVPEGWIAFPDDFYGEPDPEVVHIYKDSKDETDLFMKNHVDVSCRPADLYSDLDEFLEYHAPLPGSGDKEPVGPYEFGGRSWKGFDCYDDGGHYLCLAAEGDGTELFEADIWYKFDEGDEIPSIDDEAVQMILEHIEEGQAKGAKSFGEGGGTGDGTDISSGKESASEKDYSIGSHKDAGYYEIVSYEENGESFHKNQLEEHGIAFDMMLYEDGTGYAHFMGDYYDLTWKDGVLDVVTDEGVETLYYTTANLGRKHIYIEDDISTMTFMYAGESE